MIRRATQNDAAAIGKCIVNSISSVAIKYYNNDDDIRDYWCLNKDESSIAKQILSTPTYVSELNSHIVCVGAITDQGEITRCYVSPEYLNQGLGREMLNCLENAAVNHSLSHTTVQSSLGAVEFYQKHDYVITGDHKFWGPIEMVPMHKMLAQQNNSNAEPDKPAPLI